MNKKLNEIKRVFDEAWVTYRETHEAERNSPTPTVLEVARTVYGKAWDVYQAALDEDETIKELKKITGEAYLVLIRAGRDSDDVTSDGYSLVEEYRVDRDRVNAAHSEAWKIWKTADNNLKKALLR